jgi:hypothetical protein
MASVPRKPLRVRLKPADPFDLIRLLARSQNDPRKAVAELIQNSLDAAASEVTVTRFRRGGAVCLSVHDNGRGVLDAMDRQTALQHIATHIGHSYKQHLTPEERYRLMQQGKYGIGLLGFWSVGRFLSIRSRVGGSEVWTLQLEEDKPDGSLGPEKGQKVLDPTWTEVVIRDVHPAAQRLLGGRKLADYLAFELRGQLLQRGTRLRVLDRIARGRAQQDFPVRPARFQGVPLREITEYPVEGHSPLKVELHYLPEEHGPGCVTLASAGTVVADDLVHLEAADLRHPPWSLGRLTGMIDAPFLDAAPGTRRGVVPNAKCEAFVRAMGSLAGRVSSWLAAFEEARAREADRALQARLRRVFRDLQKKLPHYELFPVAAGADGKGAGDALEGAAEREPRPAPPEEEAPEAELYPPGSIEAVKIVPGACRLPIGAEKDLQARATDATGRVLREGVSWRWSLAEGPGRLEGDGSSRVSYRADAAGSARISLEARQGDRAAFAEARIEVLEELEVPGREDIGIPDPIEVKDPEGRWRSRLREGKWEFNASHPDYLLASADPARRFRYLATLLAKEFVLRQVSGGAAEDRLLESLVEVLSAIEDRLGRPPRKEKP